MTACSPSIVSTGCFAPVPPLVRLSASVPASRPVALAAAFASLSSSRAFLYLPKYLRGAHGFEWEDAAPGRGNGTGQRDGAPGRRPSAGLRARKGPRKKARAAGGSGHAAAALAARWGRCRGPGRPGRCGQLTGVRALRAPRGLRYSNRPVALAHVVGILRVRVVLGLDVVDLVPEVRVGAGVWGWVVARLGVGL